MSNMTMEQVLATYKFVLRDDEDGSEENSHAKITEACLVLHKREVQLRYARYIAKHDCDPHTVAVACGTGELMAFIASHTGREPTASEMKAVKSGDQFIATGMTVAQALTLPGCDKLLAAFVEDHHEILATTHFPVVVFAEKHIQAAGFRRPGR